MKNPKRLKKCRTRKFFPQIKDTLESRVVLNGPQTLTQAAMYGGASGAGLAVPSTRCIPPRIRPQCSIEPHKFATIWN